MIRMFATWLRAATIPAWVTYAAAISIAAGTYHYVDSRARAETRTTVEAEHALRDAAAKQLFDEAAAAAAQKAADDIVALKSVHAMELAERGRRSDEIEAAWQAAMSKNKKLKSAVCWPASVVQRFGSLK